MVAFIGGDRLQAALRDMDSSLDTGGASAQVRVGFLENASYPDGKSVATIAFFNEFGTKTIPPRPFFRNMIKANAPTWGPAIAKLLKGNNFDPLRVLTLMGELIKGQLQQSIVSLTSPPNAPSTIARKGASKPLVDTGQMLRSVDYEVNT